MIILSKTSIIIPVGPGDQSYKNLIMNLGTFHLPSEIILVFSHLPNNDDSLLEYQQQGISILEATAGRANQMNFGARSSRRHQFWFLHADSMISLDNLKKLEEAHEYRPKDIHYFNLKFAQDGPTWMFLNQWGCWLRSRLFKLPFGDQGFFMPREVFFELGEFDTNQCSGEDHHFIWKARTRGRSLNPINSYLLTSARKYKNQGWAKTTSLHCYLTAKQAIPESFKFLRERLLGLGPP